MTTEKDLQIKKEWADLSLFLKDQSSKRLKKIIQVSKKEIEVGCDCGKPHCYYIVHAQRFNEGRLDILKPKTSKRL